MSDLQFKFDNQAYGGTDTWTVPLDDMPDYPYEFGRMREERFFRADEGALWTYRKFTKRKGVFNFVDVGSASKGTLDALLNADFNVDFYDDVNGAGGGTYTIRPIGDFDAVETAYGYWSYAFAFEEV